MKGAWVAARLLLCACAGTKAPIAPTTQPQEPLIGTPQKNVDPAGVFPLPAALAGDPRKIPIPPLELKVVKPEITALSNGVPVYLLEDHAVPLITVRALIDLGSVDEPSAKL